MGVYIKGMEMPKSCEVCPLEESCVSITECPLIPVPDHGDLIDRDALREELGTHIDCDDCEWLIKGGFCGRSGDFEDACCAVDDAPVVIPAERSEDGRMESI